MPKFEAARGRAWPAPTERIAAARQAMRSRDSRTAYGLVQAELGQHPDNDEAYLILSQIIYQDAAVDAARPGLERVLEHGPSFAGAERAFYLYGNCLLRLGDAEAALAALEAHLRLNPEHGETHFSLGVLELQQARPQQALARFQRALELFQTSQFKQGPFLQIDLARAQARIGQAYLESGQLELARAALDTSLELNPVEPQTHYLLSRVLLRLGDREAANRAVQTFQRLNATAQPGRRRNLPRQAGGGGG